MFSFFYILSIPINCVIMLIKYCIYSFLAIFLINTNSVAQNLTIQMELSTGSQIEYFFKTQTDFTAGLTKTNYSTIDIYFNDSTDAGLPNPGRIGWRLRAKIDNAVLSSYFGTQTIPASTLEIEAIDVYGNGTGAWNTLSSSYQTIATWDAVNMTVLNSLEKITLSFRCGNSVGLGSEEDGQYIGLIEFLVEEGN
jgi:hypothetical protein